MRHQASVISLILGLMVPTITVAEPFSFVALGDMPYDLPGDNVRFDRLIDAVNQLTPAFTLHVGDTKSGSTSCGNTELRKILADLNRFQAPLFYTPGDNEWRDCYRKKAGRFDPFERLFKLREMFFSRAESLGALRMQVERQADVMHGFSDYVENARFMNQEVMFLTSHVVGWNKKLPKHNADAVDEFLALDDANIAWMRESFAKAGDEGAKALVMAIHADLWDTKDDLGAWPRDTVHGRWIEAFLEHAADFGKPVLLIHGDSHTFRIDHPFMEEDDVDLPVITRLEVYGDEQVQAVRVTVDPDSPAVFGFQSVIVPENFSDRL